MFLTILTKENKYVHLSRDDIARVEEMDNGTGLLIVCKTPRPADAYFLGSVPIASMSAGFVIRNAEQIERVIEFIQMENLYATQKA